MERFICIHGHFYQPPRENPWLETVELQDSAAPYHDWNERIAVECYAPNATARILDEEGRIEQIISNYSRISFNFGPTLLAWMKDKLPTVHEAIVQADRLSQERFSGHGSALAQVYNHMILPLSNARDKRTQVLWGIQDFESRFGRLPEGMWLAETAADTETLEVLAEFGIRFTILSPYQANRIRELGKRTWRSVNGGQIDPTRPYLARLPSGRSLTLFFYDAPVSQAVAFEGLLVSGERFANRIMSAFNDRRGWDQLVHLATDGESYGHHHRHGEMALAYALHYIESNHLAKLTNYGEYLEGHPPTHEVEIHEKSAWSCSHGVGRWMRDCGCNSGGHPGWHQGWREPLRNTLDWLRDQIEPLFSAKGAEFLKDPWAARDSYIQVILNRGPENLDRFFLQHAHRPLGEAERVIVLKLMEIQRHALLMYTSCGWFFDEISGIETVQVIQYAARAMQLVKEVFQKDLEPEFEERIAAAHSNLPENGDGRSIYDRFVKPAMVNRAKAAAHYAISSIFRQYGPTTHIFSYQFVDEQRNLLASGKNRLALGCTRVVSEITHKSETIIYAILYMGEHNLTGGVMPLKTLEDYQKMCSEIRPVFENADFPQTIRLIDRHFADSLCSLQSLFKDEQRRILNDILASTREDLENRFRLITDRYTPLMKFLESTGAPLPTPLATARDLILHSDICRQIEAEPPNLTRLASLLEEAEQAGTRVLDADTSFVVKNRLEVLIGRLAANPDELDLMQTLQKFAEMVMPLPLGLNPWKVQNTYWEMLQKTLPDYRKRAALGEKAAEIWIQQFLLLGERLGFAPQKRTAEVESLQPAA